MFEVRPVQYDCSYSLFDDSRIDSVWCISGDYNYWLQYHSEIPLTTLRVDQREVLLIGFRLIKTKGGNNKPKLKCSYMGNIPILAESLTWN